MPAQRDEYDEAEVQQELDHLEDALALVPDGEPHPGWDEFIVEWAVGRAREG